MTRKTKLHEIRDYVIIALAMIEGSIGLNIFLLPNHITMGGVGGIPLLGIWHPGICILSGAQCVPASHRIPHSGL